LAFLLFTALPIDYHNITDQKSFLKKDIFIKLAGIFT